MNKYSLLTEAQFKAWVEELKELHRDLLLYKLPLGKDYFMTEQEVCEMMGVSIRTLRTYRKNKRLRCMKIEGLILFHKIVLYLDILRLHYFDFKEEDG